ncbi:MAG: alpha-glucan family phosphorylase [Desulfobacterales bacterium]|nr:alpha-glucan family phosphorylase [Desulfobacterales bacterium]
MKNLQTYQVYSKLPEPLVFLETLARNYWWSWKHDAVDLFRRIDRQLWKDAGGNPIVFSTLVPQQRLDELAKDESFLAHLAKVRQHFEARVIQREAPVDDAFGPKDTVAYLSMEFGIHETLPIFSGGLGILAGDHLKAASNMDLPLTGVGLLYRQGYFQQFLDHNGWQQEEYPDTDVYAIPMVRAVDASGSELVIRVPGPNGDIHATVWKVMVGRTPLYLLDTFVEKNAPEARAVTARLYSGGTKVRLAQEVLLGIGGVRALSAMGTNVKVCHMNEGHAAFSVLERLAQTMEQYGVGLDAAREIVPRTTIFTTHTPVAAGHDEFPPDMVMPILKDFSPRLGVSEKEILSWGQPAGAPESAPMSMFILGLRMAQFCNGVSELHGKVARRMWSFVWPNRAEESVPIGHITNGVHVSTWVSPEIAMLYERYIGPEWYMGSRKPEQIARIDEIYDEELWRAHEMGRARLLRACREQMVRQHGRRNAPKSMMEEAERVLDKNILTIGFARRFATYKRANLLLHDPDRLEAILTRESMPVQFIFAGKAHPQDNEGKALIQKIVEFARRAGLRRRIVFIENYDIRIARYLLNGTDVWLNTPRRPFEACGTSGMKAALNGVLNLSILDGWWAEGYNADCGWAIGKGEEGGDAAYIDAVEAHAFYNLLENDVISTYYDRSSADAPERWLRMMKASMKMAMTRFCSLRMAGEYTDRYYIPAARRMDALTAEGAREARDLSVQHLRLTTNWSAVKIEKPLRELAGPFRVGDRFHTTAQVHLGLLNPDEVEVHLFFGVMRGFDKVSSGECLMMEVKEDRGNGDFLYGVTMKCRDAGRYAFTAHIVPRGDEWIRNTPGMITWA